TGVLVFIGAATISYCVWTPAGVTHDYNKLARIMYLYDPLACGYRLRALASTKTLLLKNDTKKLKLTPIKWQPPVVTVSTRLAAKTRKYTKLSVLVHVFWFLVAIALRVFKTSSKLKLLKFILATSFYACVFVITFDLSMAIVYIAHIQQSLTNEMILRYSGWSVELKLNRYEDFGGWLPIAASALWIRGGIIFALNIYSCRLLQNILRTIQKREVKRKVALRENLPIPDPNFGKPNDRDDGVIYFRPGEYTPVVRTANRPSFFFF
ncbi:uncharacterized protein LOC112044130, partial [Bicyclus anynana]|uniref:Uncharacterized protein LOC112044130 n=1 Tax=Bicyclus anynana TaxID=110368 RepID=A0A6J1MJM1_BICAN